MAPFADARGRRDELELDLSDFECVALETRYVNELFLDAQRRYLLVNGFSVSQ